MKIRYTKCFIISMVYFGLFVQNHVLSQSFESYYLYLGDYPRDANPGYHEDVQGITHDENYWYITQSDADDPDPSERSLWKIPVTHNLESVSASDANIKRVILDFIFELADKGYNHFGDLTHYQYNTHGFLCVPIEIIRDGWDKKPAIAIFNSNTLAYIDHARIDGQNSAPWCAVDTKGDLYSSGQGVTSINRFTIDWKELETNNTLNIGNRTSISLFDESGHSLQLGGTQGGVLTPSGELFYIVDDGIHVFNTTSWQRIQKSTNGYGHFNYEYSPGAWPDPYEEPEGITIWDLDDRCAPGISGQLHVLMLDNDASQDEVYLKHYSGTIHVDNTHTGSQNGTLSKPFNTFMGAYIKSWNGAKFNIKSGRYPESVVINKRCMIKSWDGGLVKIGK